MKVSFFSWSNLSVAVFFTLILFSSCGNKYPEGVEEAIDQMSSKNQRKFERVFEHYQQPEDSLKLKAAYFLVENLIDFGFYAGPQIENYNVIFDVLANKPADYRENLPWYANEIGYLFDSLQAIYGPFTPEGLMLVKDADAFTTQGMIKYIDEAFEAWQNPWAKDVSFRDFCEYVLPYRNFKEPVEPWRGMFHKKFDWIYDSVTPGMSRLEVADMLNVNSELKYSNGFDRYIVSIPPSRILQSMYGNCADNSNYKAMIMRAYGIPATVDYLPQYGNNRNNHYWNAVMDENGNFVSFEEALHDINAFVAYKYRIAKVYRRTFSKNPEIEKLIAESSEILPPLFQNPRIVDVTNEYVAVTDVKLKLQHVPDGIKHVFAGAFNDNGWSMIDYARIENGTSAHFSNLGRNVAYFPFYIKDQKLIPADVPFIISEKGMIRYIEPEKETEKVRLTRKFNLHKRKVNWLKSLEGGKFQGANRADFADAVTLATIDDTPSEHGGELTVRSGRAFRYYRFLFSPEELNLVYDGDGASIAEIEFLTASGNVLEGTPLGSEGRKYNPYTPELAFDGNPLTFFEDARMEEVPKFAGIMLDRPQTIRKIRFVPRNDLNTVQPGNEYELLFWDNNQFQSLGRKVANDTMVVYDNVPKGAMLWLRNHTAGREERIFTWEDGRQVWW